MYTARAMLLAGRKNGIDILEGSPISPKSGDNQNVHQMING